VALYVTSPKTPSWSGAQLKHRDYFTFTWRFNETQKSISDIIQQVKEIKADQEIDMRIHFSLNQNLTISFVALHYPVRFKMFLFVFWSLP
jgi:hypothetical protein